MERSTILVTGGTGFLGSEIVKQLVEAKIYKVVAVDINPPALGTGTFSAVDYVRANVLYPEDLAKVFQDVKPTIVIHTVGVFDVDSARYTDKNRENIFEVNVQGTKNVVEAAKRCGASGLVYTSSITVLIDENGTDFRNADETWPTGRAKLVYGRSKTAAENLVLASNTPTFKTCSLRSAPIFGPGDAHVIPKIHSCISACETPFIVGDGTNLVDFVYVSNIAEAHILAMANLFQSGTAAGEAFFITNGEPVTARDFCIAIWKEFGHTPPFQVKIAEGLAWWLGWSLEWVAWVSGKETPLNRGLVQDATRVRYMDISKAREVLGYVPRVGLPEGLRISCQHYRRQLDGQSYDRTETLR